MKAEVILPDLPPGSQYQLIFVTAGRRDALSEKAADYNAFAAREAALSPALPPGLTWSAVASALDLPARTNAANPADVTVYNTHGGKVADAGALYSGRVLQDAPTYDQYGSLANVFVWTGSTPQGEWDGAGALGPLAQPYATIGASQVVNGWLNWAYSARQNYFPLYALSSPVTVPVPESSTLALLATIAFALGGYAWQAERGVRKGVRTIF
jgi:hypothetical protein